MSEAVDFREHQRRAAEARDAAIWPAECLESERRFGRRAARLYPLIGAQNGVRTPEGIGTLHQAIGGEARVLLMKTRATKKLMGSEKRYRPMSFFPIEEIEPYRKAGS